MAALAALLLSPGDTGPEPVPVDAADFLDPDRVERAEDFRQGQVLLFLAGLVIELGVLGLLASGRPRFVRRPIELADRRPLLGALAVGAAISLLLALVALPTGLIGHGRATDVGLSVQGTGSWLADRAKSAAIAAVLAAVGALVLIAVQRRMPRAWWAAGAAVAVAYAVLATWLAPTVLAPLFNDFEPLPDGPQRDAVLELAERADVGVGEVYSVDASRRGTGLNAYVNGIGSTKRVVLYDNLLEDVPAPVLRSVVAHELGHVANRDLARGIIFVAIVAPLGMLVVALGGSALAAGRRTGPGRPSAIPAYALVIALVSFGLTVAGNRLSREVEASADEFALDLTEDPDAFISLQQRLSTSNLSDPDPNPVAGAVLSTHPTTLERIGAALAWERDNR